MNDKAYNKCKKYYFPCISTFKTYPKKRKKPQKWIDLESSLKRVESENNTLNTYNINDTTIEVDPTIVCSQESDNGLQLSPILKYSFRERSPVIGGKDTVFSIRDTNNLIEDIHSSDSEKEPSNTIDEFISQECTELNLAQEDIVSVNEKRSIYSAPSRKRKKTFNKNGLAHHLHMALLRQNADVSFWKHEREFADKLRISENSEPLFVQVKNCYKEFGVNVLVCVDLNKVENCLVILGSATNLVCIDPNIRIKIYQPYLTKTIKYKNDNMPCYFNISKIVL